MRNHKSLLAWQQARKVTLGVLNLGHHPAPVAAGILSQLRRSSLSTQLNIAEGYACGTKGVFRRHLNIAYGSAVETRELLELLVDSSLATSDRIRPMLTANSRAQRLIMGLLKRYAPTST